MKSEMQKLLYDLYIQKCVIEDYANEIKVLEVWAKDSFGIKWKKECLAMQERRALELINNFLKQQNILLENENEISSR